mmetsp:Transcript_5198/g.9066  ORF Transcript_5198/g.9066 Transcript_5198/m.9066 type:complete len:127 (+) Transcript_5198:672-1052(+)
MIGGVDDEAVARNSRGEEIKRSLRVFGCGGSSVGCAEIEMSMTFEESRRSGALSIRDASMNQSNPKSRTDTRTGHVISATRFHRNPRERTARGRNGWIPVAGSHVLRNLSIAQHEVNEMKTQLLSP